ncbi:MAG: hypothetical protein EAZ78_00860 [Oscillatoriales cyanobacterium]|nr:MAG: hypothetical protein EAZ78_00860 [Oscillatoriales cyanobacterium]
MLFLTALTLHRSQLMPYALCPMPYALCPMPARAPHVNEKGYNFFHKLAIAKLEMKNCMITIFHF